MRRTNELSQLPSYIFIVFAAVFGGRENTLLCLRIASVTSHIFFTIHTVFDHGIQFKKYDRTFLKVSWYNFWRMEKNRKMQYNRWADRALDRQTHIARATAKPHNQNELCALERQEDEITIIVIIRWLSG